jgi:hypothetical protein
MRIFKVFLLFLIFILGCSERSSDQITNSIINIDPTEITGNLSGVLSKDKSPYKVIDTIFVSGINTLKIENGVELRFTDSSMFVIYGKVIAVGDLDNLILFTAYSGKWKGIKVYNSNQNSLFRFCIFEKMFVDLQDSSQFGGLEINSSIATIQNCVFRYNSSTQGGGLSLLYDSSLVTNNIFRENEGVAFGGAVLALESSARIINNTFFKNFSSNVGGGLVLYDPAAVDIQNNIFFQNSGTTGDPRIWLASGDSSGFSQRYNFLPIGSDNPLFVTNNDLHLQSGSICIDAGNPDVSFNDVDSSRNDQGAYGGPLGNW